MHTSYKSFFIALVLLISHVTFIYAQPCVDVTVTLEPDGTYTLDPDQILNVPLQPDQTAFVLPAFFTCDSFPQPTPVTVYIVENGDTTNFCVQHVTVLDKTPPIAGCRSIMHVQLGENGAYRFLYDEVNIYSHDLCTEIELVKFIPDRISCTDPNPMDVKMIVKDFSGNKDTCTVRVSYDDYTGPTDPIECVDSLTLYFDAENEDNGIYITPEKVLLMGIRGCLNNYSIDIYDGLSLRPGDFIGVDDTLNLLHAVLTELASGGQCTTALEVSVFYDDPCEVFSTIMCDTVCHSEPFGGCSTGHSDQDPIELPCDVYITDWCPLTDLYPDPEFIEWYGFPESANAWPTSDNQFIKPPNQYSSLFTGYWDAVNYLSTGQQIIRSWTLLNWCTQQVIEYTQSIFIAYDLTDICDTLPWNTPAGDCLSGHTLSDDVEWPADITVHSLFSHPDDLVLNPEVQLENVQPRLIQDCVGNAVSYQDFETEINDTTLRIERTWSVIDFTSEEVWAYVQIITLIHDGIRSTVCVVLEDDTPLPGVELVPGVITGGSGCHEFPDPEGIIVTPIKDSPFDGGVNILDLIILHEGLLGIRPMSMHQEIAADLNNSQALSTIDVVVFNNFLKGNYTPVWTHPWKFYEETTHLGSADISDPLMTYKFIAVKMGDLDNSYTKGLNLDDIILRTDDEVLNAGEIYAVPFYLERNENLAGFALRIKNESINLEFLNVTAPNLPAFSFDDNIIQEPDGVSIQWVSPVQNLIDGIAVDSTEALFVLHLRANENIILNEHLTLEATFDNVLKPAGTAAPLNIRLAWEDVVISSVVQLDNGRKIEFYPNPATEIIHLKGIAAQEEGKIILMDPMGRIVLDEAMQGSLDISRLHAGMYYIVFLVDQEKSVPVPMLKL